MRLDAICRVTFEDFDAKNRVLIVRDRKDPRRKDGNHHLIPLLDVSGQTLYSH